MRRPREHDRRQELRLERALCGLSNEADRELSALEVERPVEAPAEPDDYEIAAAATFLALSVGEDPLPPALRRRVENDAHETLSK